MLMVNEIAAALNIFILYKDIKCFTYKVVTKLSRPDLFIYT